MNIRSPASELAEELRRTIRDVPDFPSPGILFKDITPVLAAPELFRRCTDALAEAFAHAGVTHVAAIESRGFLVGAPIAQALGASLVPVRKTGKLPWRTARVDYELEYGTAALEVHVDAWTAGARVLVVDDVLATGGTALAAHALVGRFGAETVGFAFLVALAFLPGLARLSTHDCHPLVSF